MSLKKNIFANYASQLYVTLIGIVMVPLYVKYMGAEAYGLVGFFSMLQAWFTLLDMGLTPTIARETARFQGGATQALAYRRLVRALEGVFLMVALLGGGALFAASGYIARDWLNASKLPIAEVTASVQLMAVIIGMRWMCGLYRGAISGSEKLVWLGAYNAGIATVRFVLVLPVLVFAGATPTVFFGFQLGAAIIELAGLLYYAYRLLPRVPAGERLAGGWAALRPVLKFSLSIAFTSSVWVLVTQTDKLVLSKLLPLAEYGYFTLAVLVAGGIMMISGPISSAIMPRMARMEAQGDHAGLIALYRKSTQLVAVFAGATSLTLASCGESLLWVWTGDRALAQQAAPVLALYALGNGVLVVSAFPYYLQYAKGDLRLHLAGNAVFVLLLIPAIIWATSRYGSIGAGVVWLGMNLLSFVAWLPLVHRKFEKGLNKKWYFQDILSIQVPMVLLVVAAGGWANSGLDKTTRMLSLAAIGCGLLVTGLVFSSVARDKLRGTAAKYCNG